MPQTVKGVIAMEHDAPVTIENIIIPDPAALEVRRLLPGTRLCRNGTSGPLRRKSCPCTFVTSTILRSNAS